MPHHASPSTMAAGIGSVKSWAWACIWIWILCGWCFPVGGGAVAIPQDITTESYIYTGPTTAPPTKPAPPKDFEVTYKEAFATFVNLTISYVATLNFTKMHLRFKDPVDSSNHFISLTIGDNGIDPYQLHSSTSGRLGFKYKLGGLRRRRRYIVAFTGFRESDVVAEFSLSFLTGDNDGEDNLYNLTGIFLVLGISTIIMVVVMVCVGYEKLIHNKGEELCSFLCCRRRKKKIPKASISPEPLMVQDRGGGDETSSLDSNPRY